MKKEWKIGKRIAQGSNKEVFEVQGSSELIAFRFSDRVSVFDYGALPELIPNRGDSLFRFARVLQRYLSFAGVASAFEADASEALGCIVMRRAGGVKWNLLKKKGALTFIPLEIIFRWGAPKGSSLLKRRPDLPIGVIFEKPMIEFYTKLEDQDRLLSTEEAEKLLPKNVELSDLGDFSLRVAALLKEFFDDLGLHLWDGKIEVAVDEEGEILLIDAVTPDELRLTLPGRNTVPLSKELLRFWYSKTHWAQQIEFAKARSAKGWKSEVELPPRLGMWRIQRIAQLYEALAVCVTDRNVQVIHNWIENEELLPMVHVTGSGGREAALRHRLGLEGLSIIDDPLRADIVFVSPDSDLANGKINEYSKLGVWTFGPTRESARIEWSKDFGRQIAKKAEIPVPHFEVVEKESELERALDKFADQIPVVKFDGLAGGKGVVVAATRTEATIAAKKWMIQGPVLLEERLNGFEASAFFYVNSGRELEIRYLGCAQDFKRRFLGDEGPNTGGMGAYAPHPKVTEEDIILFTGWAWRTANVLKEQKTPFNGVLYMGLMKDEKRGWALIEYNARFGDPETQALLSLWDPGRRVLRHFLQLDVSTEVGDFLIDEKKALCLSLVRPQYPDPAPEVEFPEWKIDDLKDDDLILYENEKKTGRVAYLVARDQDLLKAGDRIFKVLVESPWKDLVEWRSDILK